jgi:hypothetical protein
MACSDGGGDGGSGSTISLSAGSKAEWDAAVTTMKGGDDGAKYVITLSDDLGLDKNALSFSWDDAANVAITIKGEGHTIRLNTGSTGYLLALSDQTLVLENVTLTGHGANNVPLVGVGASAALTMNDKAKITGNKGDNGSFGGGVYISGMVLNGKVVGGSFTMNNGAEISGNDGSDGGGVYVLYGTFTMNGGTISGNNAASGGGVFVDGIVLDGEMFGGSFTMNNGTISGNDSHGSGGGVYIKVGSFVKTGGTIYGNDGTDNALKNTTNSSNGHAVYYINNNVKKYRDTTAGPDVKIDTGKGDGLSDA